MDDDDQMYSEKQSIRESGRALKKYGSVSNHVRNSDVLIRHDLVKDETLAGIALKYECTTEQIRRANRLFASDSLYLRQFLMIPVEKGSPFYPKDDHRPQSLPPQRAISGYPSLQQNSNNSISLDNLSPEEEYKKNLDELLGKIDSSIAESRKYVRETQKKGSEFISQDELDNGFTHNRRLSSTPSTSSSTSYQQYQQVPSSTTTTQHHHRQGSSGSSSDATAAPTSSHVIVQMTQGRRIQTSIQKHEREQNEFFEL